MKFNFDFEKPIEEDGIPPHKELEIPIENPHPEVDIVQEKSNRMIIEELEREVKEMKKSGEYSESPELSCLEETLIESSKFFAAKVFEKTDTEGR